MCSLSPGAAWKIVQEQKDNSQGLVSPLQAGITYFLLKLYGPVSQTQIKPSPRLKSMSMKMYALTNCKVALDKSVC
ncbi:hypothetical protein J4Q44_G00207490 [Coregonus suidteri]|uniref:Uncharacterized protein n=1 Tax=Coregonus suidteri TaxID=861788 RepID=A0AAN8LWC6_9TELE